MVYVFRCLKKEGDPIYFVSYNDDGNIPAKDYERIENLGFTRIDVCSDEYESKRFSEVLERKLPGLYEDLKTHLNEVRETRGKIADINKIIKEIEDYKLKPPEKK